MKQTHEMADERNSTRSLRPVLVLLIAYFALCFGMACRKYDAMNSDSGNNAMLVNAFWYAARGKGFYSPYIDMSYLGNHAGLILFLLLPLYWLVPSVYTLLFLNSLAIALSGLPFYLIARHVLKEYRSALLITVAYLFYPTIIANHFNQLAVERLALPFLLGGLYFLLTQKFWPFVACMLLTMTVQENLPLTVGMIGAYAAVRRYDWKWIVAPIGLALGYGLVVFNVVLPYFAGHRGYLPSHYFGSLGQTPGELVRNCLSKPWILIEHICNLDRGLYLLEMLQPLLWLVPFFAVELLLVTPSLGVNLVIDEHSFRVIPWHYNPTVGALLCVATVFGIKRLANILETRWQLTQPRFALALSIGALSVASWPLWLNIEDYLLPAYYPALRRVVELIPPEKSVVAPATMLAHFANREYPFHQRQFDPSHPMSVAWPREKMYSMDYVILDANERRFPQEIVTSELWMSFRTNTNYQLIFNENNVFVFRRVTAGSPPP